MITRTILSLLLATALISVVFAQAPQETKPAASLPPVDQIIEKNIKAMGGKEALQKITSRTSKGTLEAPDAGISGKFEQFAKAPNKLVVSVDLSVAVFKLGFDGAKGWVLDPGAGMRDMTATELLEQKVDNDFHSALTMKERYAKLEVKEKIKVGDREAYVVEATPAGHKPDKLYFDAQTFLVIRTIGERDSSQGTGEVDSYLEDYRDVDGTKVPFTIRRITSGLNFTVKISEVVHNQPIDDAKFARPAQ